MGLAILYQVLEEKKFYAASHDHYDSLPWQRVHEAIAKTTDSGLTKKKNGPRLVGNESDKAASRLEFEQNPSNNRCITSEQ